MKRRGNWLHQPRSKLTSLIQTMIYQIIISITSLSQRLLIKIQLLYKIGKCFCICWKCYFQFKISFNLKKSPFIVKTLKISGKIYLSPEVLQFLHLTMNSFQIIEWGCVILQLKMSFVVFQGLLKVKVKRINYSIFFKNSKTFKCTFVSFRSSIASVALVVDILYSKKSSLFFQTL